MRIAAGNSEGFTLLEVIISLTITAVMLVIIFGAMRVGVRAWEKGEEDLDERLRNRVVLDMMKRQLASVAFREQKEGEKNRFLFVKGDKTSLRFISNVALLPSNEFGAVFVRYNVEDDVDSDGKRLDMLEKNLVFIDPEDDPDKFGRDDTLPILSGISDVSFNYLKRGEEGDEEWQDSWDPDTEKGFPAAFKVEITAKEDQTPLVTIARAEAATPEEKAGSPEKPERASTAKSNIENKSSRGTSRLGGTKSRFR